MNAIHRLKNQLTDPTKACITLVALRRYQDITGRGTGPYNALSKKDGQSKLWQQVLASVTDEAKSDQLTLDLEQVRSVGWSVEPGPVQWVRTPETHEVAGQLVRTAVKQRMFDRIKRGRF